MKASRSRSARLTALGGALTLAASALVGTAGIVALATPAGATTTPLGPSTCDLLIGSTTEPTVITPNVTADITPSPAAASGSFSLSTLTLSSVLDPAANPTLVEIAGDTVGITFTSTLSAKGATPTSQPVTFAGNFVVPKPFTSAVTFNLSGSAGGFTADGAGTKSANVKLSGNGSLALSIVGTSLDFTGPCTGSAPTKIASVKVVAPAAKVTNVIPNAGVITGGTKVKLVGKDLSGATAVDFGTTPATSFQVVSPTEIEAVSPPITTNGSTTQTPVNVEVTTPAGPPKVSPRDTFTYVDPTLGAIVSSVSPKTGPPNGGNTVTITGFGFNNPVGGPATAVYFGSVNQPNFTVVSDDVITTTAPPGSGVVNVTVIGNDGSTPSVISSADRYTYTSDST
jgi:hypothetical protein